MSRLTWSPTGINIGVNGIVVSGDKVLLIQRADLKYWAFPGGSLETGETLAEGLKREVREETGLIIEPERLSGVYIRNRWRRHLVFVFVCRYLSGETQLSDESIAVRWFDQAGVAAKLADKNLLERFNDAMSDNRAVLVRFQNFTRPQLIWHWLKQDARNLFRA